MKEMKIIFERRSDGYLAYPQGLRGMVVGEGNTREEALEGVKDAILFHLERYLIPKKPEDVK
ncbi:type II toxin-antitoxin system HicB family antitoxin [bacterium]|nr:type II toxin-antitoxin system HicB family antitoxin [bacterium]